MDVQSDVDATEAQRPKSKNMNMSESVIYVVVEKTQQTESTT